MALTIYERRRAKAIKRSQLTAPTKPKKRSAKSMERLKKYNQKKRLREILFRRY